MSPDLNIIAEKLVSLGGLGVLAYWLMKSHQRLETELQRWRAVMAGTIRANTRVLAQLCHQLGVDPSIVFAPRDSDGNFGGDTPVDRPCVRARAATDGDL